MGVEWADRPEPADADPPPGRDRPGNAAPDTEQAAGRDGPGSEQAVGRRRPVALTDPERRVAEYHRHRAIVEQAAGPPSEAARAWSAAVPEFLTAWEKIKVKYGYPERAGPVAQPADGSWRGAGGRRLDQAQNTEIDRACARIREVGERAIIPGVRAVEAEEPTRRLAGFEHRFKGPDRLKEKIVDRMRAKGRPPAETLAQITDVVRFTFQYSETAYSAGVMKDMGRLEAKGFTQVERRNTWESDQYKGINSRWREPKSGVTFEVQFHTRASLEAKELTHKAYEGIRSIRDETSEADREASELKEFQRRVNSMIPIPPGVADIDDYREISDDRRDHLLRDRR